MIFVGNYKSWINETMMNSMLSSNGDRRPSVSKAGETNDLMKLWESANYEPSRIGWGMFYESHLGKFPPPINITGEYEHWFSKLNPGDMLPLHDDRFEGKPMQSLIENGKTVKRYWMACQDMIPGHVFAYEDTLLDNYKAGDMFLFPTPYALHGSANLGLLPKISYQLTVVS